MYFSSVFLLIFLITFKANSLVIETINEYGAKKNNPDLNILSSTDVEVFEPLIKLFVKNNKQLRVQYITASTSDIFKEITNKDLVYKIHSDIDALKNVAAKKILNRRKIAKIEYLKFRIMNYFNSLSHK